MGGAVGPTLAAAVSSAGGLGMLVPWRADLDTVRPQIRETRESEAGRLSFRGVAVELRECLREVLDHLVPDDEVTKMTGFKLEGDQKKPTMRQKARFVFRSRERPDSAMKAPEDAVSAAEERAASLVRSVYERGNVSTHVATTGGEVRQLKMYVDSALADLLQIHRAGK